MIGEISSFVGKAVGNSFQSWGSEKLIEKVTALYDDKIKYPQLISDVKFYIKERYSQYPFYNDLDSYTERYHIILRLLVLFGEANMPTQPQFVEEHLGSFIKEYPQYQSYDSSFVKDILNYIYAETKKRVIELSVHSDLGKVQRLIKIESNENKEEIAEIKSMLTTLLANQSQSSTTLEHLNSVAKDDVGSASKKIELFLKKIDAVGTDKNPVVNDADAILKFQELSSDALVSLLGENPEQIKMVICSIQCHLAIHFSNLGEVDNAFECLGKISDVTAEKSKLYHFVNAVIIVNHGKVCYKYYKCAFHSISYCEFDCR